MDGEGERPGFLPPEPGGREPDLGEAETQRLPQTDAGPQSPAYGGYAPPADAAPQPPQQPVQGWQAQPQQPWGYAPRPVEPDNGSAVAGFVLSAIGGGLLLVTLGLSTVVSAICSIIGIVYSKRGRERVDRGETPKHRSLAQAGFIIGIVSLVLSALATLGYGALLILFLTDEEFQRDLEREFERELDQSQTGPSHVMLAVAALRLARGALSLVG